MKTSLLLLPLCALACGSAHVSPSSAPVAKDRPAKATVASAARPAIETLASDGMIAVSTGATFTGSKGWSLERGVDRITLRDPEKLVQLTFIDVEANTGEEAILEAFRKVDPAFARKPRHTARPPARDGWDETVQISFETREDERRIVTALARKKGQRFYVSLLDGSLAGVQKRGAQLMTAIDSFKVAGVEEESFAGKEAHLLDAGRLRALEAFVAQAQKDAHVPGAAMGIVQKGKVVFEKAWGVRELGKPETVTPKTLFMIGSTTKSLTATLMNRLVDEGAIDWDTPLVKYLPDFRLADEDVTQKITLKHTVCACTGMPRRDLEFFFAYSQITPEMRIASMRDMKPTTGFGETFQYSNLLVAAGGFAAAHVAKPRLPWAEAYESAMQEKVFRPLGMHATTTQFGVASRVEHASPHAEDAANHVAPFALRTEEGVASVAPAGAVWSNIVDMEKYLLMELGQGVVSGGKRFVSETHLLERRKPQIKLTDKVHYGLGFFLEDLGHVKVVGHPGNNLGFSSDMFFLPEHGVGLVLLTNGSGANAFRDAIKRKLFELLFDARDEAQANLASRLTNLDAMKKKERAKIDAKPDAAWLSRWLGAYESRELGPLVFTNRDGAFVVDVGDWKSKALRLREEDGTEKLSLVDAPWAGGLTLTPRVGADGARTLSIETPQHTYVFTARAR